MTLINSILPLLQACKTASKQINHLSNAERIALTKEIASALAKNIPEIILANKKDLSKIDPQSTFYDRLLLNEVRLKNIVEATIQVSELPDPVGKTLLDMPHQNGMNIRKITVPLGVVGAIYEARPNVTIDIAALCFRSGNAVVLKGGTDAAATNSLIVKIIQTVLIDFDLPVEIITLLPNERSLIPEFLTATKYIDVIVPRGSQQLINFVRANATVPTIETGAGVCHTYVESSANLPMAAAIVANAKTQRPSVCNALDTVLVDEAIAADFLPLLISPFLPFEVGIYADEKAFGILSKLNYPHLYHATDDDFGREYLSQNCSVKLVSDMDEALAHIALYGSRHSEAIITEDHEKAVRFLTEVDAAAVYSNASTRFTDGEEFGLGAELGISTQKLHARGPFALEKLVCEKWIIRGSGQIRL